MASIAAVRPWYHRLPAIFATGFAIPPVALVLLWTRKGASWWKNLLLTFPLLLLGVAHLFAIWGMRVQMDGAGYPLFYFPAGEKHYAEIDRRAAQDRATVPPPAAAPAPAVEPAKPAAVEPAAAKPELPAPWPGFLGKNRDGIYAETPILTAWPPSGLKQIWKRPVGGGYASMTVAQGLVFTIEQRRKQEFAVAYDFKTGREVWTSSWDADFQESMGGPGPRATPTWDEGRIYFLGAEGEFRCLDAASGKIIWRKNILTDNGATNAMWGMAASPLVYRNTVVVLPGGPDGKSVVAYNKLSGERQWSALDDKAAYAAPMLVTLNGQEQVVVLTAKRAVGLTSDGGKLLWEFPWITEYDVNATNPTIAGPNRLVLTGGYGHGSALIEISKDGAREIWKSQAIKNRFNTQVLHNGVIYGLDEGILAAMDVETGARKWKGGRYGYGQLLLAGEHLLILTESGDVVLVKATPESHQEIARFSALDGKTWNVPAIASGHLLVRNTTEMACYRIAP